MQTHFNFMADNVARKARYYAGYSFGWANAHAELAPYVQGCVVAPRWARRAWADVGDARIILDNGAFGAWKAGEHLTLFEQLAALEDAVELFGPERIDFVVWPDVVANAALTQRRFVDTLRAFSWRGLRALHPVQEGAAIEELARIASWRGDGLFIGGATEEWKLATAERIRRTHPELYLHVGRLYRPGHIHRAAQIGIDSFDTTVFARSNHWNARQRTKAAGVFGELVELA